MNRGGPLDGGAEQTAIARPCSQRCGPTVARHTRRATDRRTAGLRIGGASRQETSLPSAGSVGRPDDQAPSTPLRHARAALRRALEQPGADAEQELNAILSHGVARYALHHGAVRGRRHRHRLVPRLARRPQLPQPAAPGPLPDPALSAPCLRHFFDTSRLHAYDRQVARRTRACLRRVDRRARRCRQCHCPFSRSTAAAPSATGPA